MQFNQNLSSTKACEKTYKLSNPEDVEKLTFLRDRIKEAYMHSWVVDNMPVTWCYHVLDAGTQYCATRFPIGCYVDQDGKRQEFCYLSVGVKKNPCLVKPGFTVRRKALHQCNEWKFRSIV